MGSCVELVWVGWQKTSGARCASRASPARSRGGVPARDRGRRRRPVARL